MRIRSVCVLGAAALALSSMAQAQSVADRFGATDHTWSYMGPGGLGTNLPAKIHPRVHELMLVGSNQSGVYESTDSGASFTIASDTLRNLVINDITFTLDGETEIALLATTQGIYRAEASPVSPLNFGDDWSFIELGTTPAFWGQDHADENYTYLKPMRVVSASPADPDYVWAGAGEYLSGFHLNFASDDVNRSDDTTVWLSTDAGLTWSPSVTLFEGDVLAQDINPKTRAHVFEIMPHPTDRDTVWVATNRGLYRTTDGGARWDEVGVEYLRYTTNQGSTWSDETTASCSGDCLPINTMTTLCSTTHCGAETHPHITDLSYALDENDALSIYATFWERHHLDGNGDNCGGLPASRLAALSPTELIDDDLYRGGPYRSDDGGLTWTYLLDFEQTPFTNGSGGASLDAPIYMPCGSSTSTASQYPWVHAKPYDPDSVFFVGRGNRGGLMELDDTGSTPTYTWWSDFMPGLGGSDNCDGWSYGGEGIRDFSAELGCYEGNRAGGIAQRGRLPDLMSSCIGPLET